MSKLLVTCGCSWTFGVGVAYESGMSKEKYVSVAWDDEVCNKKSFRGILSDRFGFQNLNFAMGGASNQQQFRLVKEFFSSACENSLLDQYQSVVVLHGITSTARTETYINDLKKVINFKFDNPDFAEYSKPLVTYFYDHDNEIAKLTEEMKFMNVFYKAIGVKNLWFDTFNHHYYKSNIDNLFNSTEEKRDLMSQLLLLSGFSDFDNEYHKSSWTVDTNRIKPLVSMKLLNPMSNHPTAKGHQMIADMLTPALENL